MTHSYPPGGTQGAPGASATLPRGGPLLRAYSPAVAPAVPTDRIKSLPQTGKHYSLISLLSPGLITDPWQAGQSTDQVSYQLSPCSTYLV